MPGKVIKALGRARNPLRRPRYRGELPPHGIGVIEQVRQARRERVGPVVNGGLGGAVVGASTAVFPILLARGSERAGVIYGLVTTAVGAVAQYGVNSGHVRRATRALEGSLRDHVGENRPLKTFLEKNRYVFIDRKGQLTGTNLPRLVPGVGRIRLSSARILGKK